MLRDRKGGGGGGSAGGGGDGGSTGTALLGNLAGATVEVFRIDDDGSLVSVYQTTTSSGSTLSQMGRFDTRASSLADDGLYVFQISGGMDWDADDDGVMDTSPTTNDGVIRAVALGSEVKACGDDFTVTWLSELQYRYLAKYLKYDYDPAEFLTMRDELARAVLAADVDGDGDVDQQDVLKFVPSRDKADKPAPHVRQGADDFIDDIREDWKLSTISLMASLGTTGVSGSSTVYKDRIVYVGKYDGTFSCIDVSNSTNPVVICTTPVASSIYSIAVTGSYAYLGGQQGTTDTITILDISDPSAPTTVAIMEVGGISADLEIEGNYLYSTQGASPIVIYDISTPTAPTTAATLPGNVDMLCVEGDVLYVYDWTGYLKTYDVSDPTSPRLLASIQPPLDVYAMDATGRYLYAAGETNSYELDVFDVLNPAAPSRISTIAIYDCRALWLQGKYVFISSASDSLSVVDVGIPTSPAVVNVVRERGPGICGDGADYIYLVSSSRLEVMAARVPERADTVCWWSKGVQDFDMGSDGGLFLLDTNYLYHLNLSSRRRPREDGRMFNQHRATIMDRYGDYVYLTYDTDGNGDGWDDTCALATIDVSTPSSPLELGSETLPSNRGSVGAIFAGLGDTSRVYLATKASSTYGAKKISVETPSNPTYESEGGPTVLNDITGKSGYLYGVWDVNLYVMDVSSAPTTAATTDILPGDGSLKRLELRNDVIYAMSGSTTARQVWLFDVSTPTDPIRVGVLDLSSLDEGGLTLRDVCCDGRYLYVGCNGSYGIVVADVSDSSSPRILGTIPASNCSKLEALGEFIGVLEYYGVRLLAPDLFGKLSEPQH